TPDPDSTDSLNADIVERALGSIGGPELDEAIGRRAFQGKTRDAEVGRSITEREIATARFQGSAAPGRPGGRILEEETTTWSARRMHVFEVTNVTRFDPDAVCLFAGSAEDERVAIMKDRVFPIAVEPDEEDIAGPGVLQVIVQCRQRLGIAPLIALETS